MSSEYLRQTEFQRILLIKPSAMGDIVHALPVLHGLRTRFPQAHITWLVNSSYAPLLEGHGALDEVIRFDRHTLHGWRGAARLPRAAAGLLRALRGRDFDLALDLQGLFRTGLMALASRARVRLGFDPAREGAGIFYNHRIPCRNGAPHAVHRNYEVARVLGFEDVPLRFDLPIQDAERRAVQAHLGAAGHGEGTPYLVVLPASRWETKNWPPERFAQAIERLHHDRGLAAVLAGGRGERGLCERIGVRCPDAIAANLAGRTSLPELAALLAGARAVLCNDSGPMHLAAAVDTPIVAIFGPTSPERTGPIARTVRVLRTELPCSPCFLRSLRECPHDHDCMTRLSVDTVVGALAEVLG